MRESSPLPPAAQTDANAGNQYLNPLLALSADIPEFSSSYEARDVALYALGVGAARDPLDAAELRWVYEGAAAGQQVLATFASIPATRILLDFYAARANAAPSARQSAVPGLNFGFERMVHGEHYLALMAPLPPAAQLKHKLRIKAIYDKGKHAVVVQGYSTRDALTDQLLCYNEISLIVHGAGGWGGERGPARADVELPARTPDAVIEEITAPNQALLYRLSGDLNPLHVDLAAARSLGFERPILHGLCTLGFAGRHLLQACSGQNASAQLRDLRVRFAGPVYPGETLTTQMWHMPNQQVRFQTLVDARVVLSQGTASWA